MPANSGKHENQILSTIQESGSKSELFTCDRDFKKPEATAIWFDMCGPLTLVNLEGIVDCCVKLFKEQSLLFVTLCVHGARGLINDSITKKIYSHVSCPQMRADITQEILDVHISPYKKIKALREPYVYKRGSATFAVFFLSIK
jgi:hypothetical protein